jgi:D-xylose transport system permease protein
MTVKPVTVEAGPDPDAELGETVFQRALARVKSGDLGSGPILLGVVLVGLFFYFKNSIYLSPENLSNLIVQMAGVSAVAMGVVFVLLLGEIDLSIGSVSGVAGVVVAELQLADSGHDYPGLIAIAAALVVGALIGAVQGSFVAFIGVPSFVVTLAGLLFFQGVILKALPQSVIIIDDPKIVDVANYYFSDTGGWILATIVALGYLAITAGSVVNRRRHGITSDNLMLVAVKIVAVAVGAFFVVWELNRASGVPFAGVLILALAGFWTYVATRTTFGRHVYAVGGNAEAARRAGISVARIKVYVFMISGLMAAVGGIIFASRLLSVNTAAGQGTLLLDAISAAVIGGTSLFGGRGEVKSALLGALIISMIANGIALVGYQAYIQLMVTALILLAAVTLDTVLRKRQIAAGR